MLLPSGTSAVGIFIVLTTLAPPAVSYSPSNADSSVSYLLHLTMLATLSSVPVPPTRYFPPAPSFCLLPGRSYVTSLPSTLC